MKKSDTPVNCHVCGDPYWLHPDGKYLHSCTGQAKEKPTYEALLAERNQLRDDIKDMATVCERMHKEPVMNVSSLDDVLTKLEIKDLKEEKERLRALLRGGLNVNNNTVELMYSMQDRLKKQEEFIEQLEKTFSNMKHRLQAAEKLCAVFERPGFDHHTVGEMLEFDDMQPVLEAWQKAKEECK